MGSVEENPAGGDIHERDVASRLDPRPHDAVVADGVVTSAAATIATSGHSGFHERVPGSNRRMRVLPVSPKIRITY
jgi:hypothetical protein